MENTLHSFECAFAEGADGVELDVRITRDRIAVVFHDDVLPTGEKLAELGFAELKLRAAQIPIFTLEKVLRHVAGKGYLDIEIKDAELCEIIVPLVRQLLPPDSYVYSSFLTNAIYLCRRLDPQVPAIWIVEDGRYYSQHLEVMEQMDATAYAPWHETLTPEIAREFTSRGIPLVTFTVNEVAQAKRLAELGVVGIISDRPGELVKGF